MDNITETDELNMLGYNLMYAGNPTEAMEYFDKAEKADPNNIRTYINKGLCFAGMEDYVKAKDAFLKAYKINKKEKEVITNLANICYLMRDFYEGIDYANTAIEYGLADDSTYFNLALAWEELNNDINAIRNYNKAIELNPYEVIYHLRKSNCLVHAKKFDEALEALELLNHYCPDSFESYHYSFLIYLQKGEYLKANAVIDAGLDMFPGDVSLYYDKIRILSIVKNFDDALKLIKAIEKLDNFESEARNIKVEEAKIYMQTNKFDSAIKALEDAVHMEGAHDFEAHYYLVNAYLSQHQFDKAEAIAKIMIDADDGSAFARSAYYYLPMCMLKQGKPEAQKQYKTSIQKLRIYSLRHPEELDAALFRALCHKDIAEYDKALEVLDYTLKLKKDYAPAHAIKANVLKDMGKIDEYEKELAIAKESNEALNSILSEFGI
jgi:tetratricopeptide (TPR) repeat protein